MSLMLKTHITVSKRLSQVEPNETPWYSCTEDMFSWTCFIWIF